MDTQKEVRTMKKYTMQFSISEKKIEEILDRLEKAKEEIYECYRELSSIGIEMKPDSPDIET